MVIDMLSTKVQLPSHFNTKHLVNRMIILQRDGFKDVHTKLINHITVQRHPFTARMNIIKIVLAM